MVCEQSCVFLYFIYFSGQNLGLEGKLYFSAGYLLLEVVVREVEDLQSSISPGHSQPLRAVVKRHGSDSSGHVVEEANTVHLELSHFTLRKNARGRLLQLGKTEP